MMRKAWILLIVLVFILAAGCGREDQKPPADETPEAEVTEEAETAKEERRPLKVVFYGASNFGRWEELSDLFPDTEAVNTAINGSTDKSQLEKAPEAVYAFEPDLVFIQTATNDFSKSMTLEEVLEEKRLYFETLKENLPRTRFVIMAPLPQPGRPDFWEDVQKVTDWIHEWCGENEDFYCIDTTEEMLRESGPEELLAGEGKYYAPDLFEKDGIHLNEKGRTIWQEAIEDFLEEAGDLG